MSDAERDWFLSAELPVIFSDILSRFSQFAPLVNAAGPTSQMFSTDTEVPGETIPLSSSLKDDHVKGHIKMKGPLITKTELSIEINHTPVPIKTVVSIKEEEHNPWQLHQLGYAANYLFYVKQRCEDIAQGKVYTFDKARRTLDTILDELKRCKHQFVLPKQKSTTTFNRNHCVFSPELPPGLLVNFHIKDNRLVLTISCLKNPQDLHAKDKYSVPQNAYADRTIMLPVHWMVDMYDKLTRLQNEIQLVYQKMSVLGQTTPHQRQPRSCGGCHGNSSSDATSTGSVSC